MVARLGRDWELFYCQCDLLLSYFTVLVSNFVVEFGLDTLHHAEWGFRAGFREMCVQWPKFRAWRI